jgi:hypothetical protein
VGCYGDAVVIVVWWIYILAVVFWYGCVVDFSRFGGFRGFGFSGFGFWVFVFVFVFVFA